MNGYLLKHLDKVTVEELDNAINEFNKASFVINGKPYADFKDPVVLDRLNARYAHLTGQDHPVYHEVLPGFINDLISNKERLLASGEYDQKFFRRVDVILNGIDHPEARYKYVEGEYPLTKQGEVLKHLGSASLDDITSQLSCFGEESYIVNGEMVPAFIDPIIACQLNARYYELTNTNNVTFMRRIIPIIEELISHKADLIATGKYKDDYFNKLQLILNKVKASMRRLITLDHDELLALYQDNASVDVDFNINEQNCEFRVMVTKDYLKEVRTCMVYQFNDEFITSVLEPMIDDFVNNNPGTQSNIIENMDDTSVNYVLSSGNNRLNVNGLSIKYVDNLEDRIKPKEKVIEQQPVQVGGFVSVISLLAILIGLGMIIFITIFYVLK